ncbi:nuclease-related domain-containing protein [Streptomyces sp. NPDC059447]|uniref:nuclease-related domain-containing protein n=1 Tax=Streptomyces sp. NPDC059447 TaxID=3346834 RepID=UPI003678914C
MSDLTVGSWKRHGLERLYVNLPDGTAVAWADCKTKAITIKVPQYQREAVALLRQHLGDSAAVRPPSSGSAQSRDTGSGNAPRTGRGIRRGPDRPPKLPQLTVADDLAKNPPGAVLIETIAARGPSFVQRAWSKMLRRPSEWDSWYRGLEGERRVGRELQRLTAHGWRVLHGVRKSNGGDIDHLLIGGGGIFTINTKNHPGASIWVGDEMAKVNGGPPVPYAAASKGEAAYVRGVLERYCGFAVPVEPVLVFAGAASIRRAITQHDVRVYLEREVSSLGPLSGKLSTEQVDQVYAVARHQRAWLRS